MGTPTTGFKTGSRALQKIKEKENITPQQEVGEGKGQNQDGRIFTFFTYVFSSVICFPLGREQERFCM